MGKTTLARKLAEAFHYPLLLEPSVENPFLEHFYRERRANALRTQLFFLLHRAEQAARVRADDLVGPMLVADFLFEKDQLFAELTLDPAEYALYQQIQAALDVSISAPDLVIYLQAPTDVLMRRIRQRGLEAERHIDPEYLAMLIDAYTEFFHFFDKAPLLIVNAAEIDLATNEDHFQTLVAQIHKMEGLRHYFNPQPSLL